jgi:hypothetical protein
MPKKHEIREHRTVQGLPIAIEHRKGDVRSGVSAEGKAWRTVMKFPYGFIQGTRGADGEEIDAYIGPKPEASSAFVVHQVKDTGKYDEDKVLLGFSSMDAARKAYLVHHQNNPKFIGAMHEVSVDRLKKLVSKGEKIVKLAFFDELEKIWSDR